MLKNNKGKLLLTSLITLLPILAGLLLWNGLPERMVTHWGVGGEADGWGGKAFAVFAPPLILLAAHWLCILVTVFDSRNIERNRRMFGIVLWILPILSVVTSGFIYAATLGWDISGISVVMSLLLGVMFLVIGNYLPKCRQNFTIGIKVKWTLANEENWNATHRFGGRVWMICGLAVVLCCFLPFGISFTVLMIAALTAGILPTVYSYRYYQKQVAAGTAPAKAVVPMSRGMKIAMIVTLILLVPLLAAVPLLLYTGDVTVEYGADSFTVDADYWTSATVAYTEIRDLEYRESFDEGTRVIGVGSPHLLAGDFSNGEFGGYTLYAYTKGDSAVVMNVCGRTLVIRLSDDAATRTVYETLLAKLDAIAPVD